MTGCFALFDYRVCMVIVCMSDCENGARCTYNKEHCSKCTKICLCFIMFSVKQMTQLHSMTLSMVVPISFRSNAPLFHSPAKSRYAPIPCPATISYIDQKILYCIFIYGLWPENKVLLLLLLYIILHAFAWFMSNIALSCIVYFRVNSVRTLEKRVISTKTTM